MTSIDRGHEMPSVGFPFEALPAYQDAWVGVAGFDPTASSSRSFVGVVNGGRNLTPFRRLKIDPLGVHSSVVEPGTRPRSRSLMR